MSTAAPPPPGPGPDRLPERPRRVAIAAVRPRVVVTTILIIVGIAAALWLVWLTRRIITWVLIAAFLAAVLNPAVDAFQKRLRLRRVPAISVTFLLGLSATAGILLMLVPPLIDAGQELADDAPGYVDRLADTRLVRELDERYDVVDRMQEFVRDLPDRLGGADTAVSVVQTLFSGLVGTLTVLVLTFLFLIYGRQLRDQAIASLPADRRARFHGLLSRMYKSVGGYVAGNILVSIIAGVAAYIVMRLFGIPAAAALAFWVAITDLVPLVGATVGAIPAVSVAFFSGWPIGVGVAAYFLIYQQVENNFVQPIVMRKTTRLNPLAVLVAVLVGAELLGILGALLAIPAAAMIKLLAADLLEHRRRRPPAPMDAA